MAMMLKFWNWYQNSLSVHPVKTQVTTSCVLWAVGDVTAQYITHSAAASKKRLQLSVTTVRISPFFLIFCKFSFK
jgi:protein Mpv17